MYSETDCQDYKDAGYNESGVYHVKPLGMRFGFKVYCDMITDGGGWLVRDDTIILLTPSLSLSLSLSLSKPHIFSLYASGETTTTSTATTTTTTITYSNLLSSFKKMLTQ